MKKIRFGRSRLVLLFIGVILIFSAFLGYTVHELIWLEQNALGHISKSNGKLDKSSVEIHERLSDGEVYNAESKIKFGKGHLSKENKALSVDISPPEKGEWLLMTSSKPDPAALSETRSSSTVLQSKLHKESEVFMKRILRGVDPSKAFLYYDPNSLSKVFHCLDGNETISLYAINDDFCDCRDGSDEPGTSACQKGRFFCPVEMKYLDSMDVNDGICHCCDGADEWKGNRPAFVLPDNPNLPFAPCRWRCGT